jgi:ribonuclease HI
MNDSSEATESPHVLLFSDGACSGNPGPGGWAYILRHVATGTTREDSGGEAETTNNRMELRGAIEGLLALKRPCIVELYTDSEYVRKGLAEWMKGWKARGWKRLEKGKPAPIKNVELWQQLDELVARHRVTFHRVAGHSGHPENDRCDELAVAAYQPFLRGRR